VPTAPDNEGEIIGQKDASLDPRQTVPIIAPWAGTANGTAKIAPSNRTMEEDTTRILLKNTLFRNFLADKIANVWFKFYAFVIRLASGVKDDSAPRWREGAHRGG